VKAGADLTVDTERFGAQVVQTLGAAEYRSARIRGCVSEKRRSQRRRWAAWAPKIRWPAVRSVPTAATAAAVALLLAGCGGGGGSAQPAGSIKVTLTEFKFDPSKISAPSGKVVFYLVNAGTTQHDLIIRDSSNHQIDGSELISAGDTFVFTVNSIAAGTYTYFCDQSGHEASGMKGTLTIT
jgi:plastocyanin